LPAVPATFALKATTFPSEVAVTSGWIKLIEFLIKAAVATLFEPTAIWLSLGFEATNVYNLLPIVNVSGFILERVSTSQLWPAEYSGSRITRKLHEDKSK
jgi:hypothetical protein